MNYFDEIETYLKNKGVKNDIGEDTLISSLGIDSLHYMEMIMHIEEKWDLVFSDEELLSIVSISDLLKIIHSKK